MCTVVARLPVPRSHWDSPCPGAALVGGEDGRCGECVVRPRSGCRGRPHEAGRERGGCQLALSASGTRPDSPGMANYDDTGGTRKEIAGGFRRDRSSRPLPVISGLERCDCFCLQLLPLIVLHRSARCRGRDAGGDQGVAWQTCCLFPLTPRSDASPWMSACNTQTKSRTVCCASFGDSCHPSNQ